MPENVRSRRARIDAALAHRLGRREDRIAGSDAATAPLTQVQQSLWIMSQLAGDEAINNRPLNIRIRGKLDVPALERSLSAIVERHAVLRTTFPVTGSEPTQVVGHIRAVVLPIRDVSSSVHPLPTARQKAREHAGRRFDLTIEPPFRPLLIRLDAEDHILAVAMHHIVFDGWSERLFLDELAAHYDSVIESGQPSGTPELPFRYADFSRWQSQREDEAELDAELDFWQRQLADLPPDVRLPVDRSVTPGAEMEPVDLRLPAELVAGLERIGKETGATLFMTLLAALNVLIRHYTRHDDIVIGIPTPGRSLPEVEDLIGCFINTVLVRSDLSTNPSFRTLLTQVRQTTLRALDNSSVAYSRVLGAVRPWARDRLPLYRVHFQLRDFPGPVRLSKHLRMDVYDPTVGANNHLSIRATRDAHGATVTFGYAPDIFRRSTIERWAGHFRRLLEGIAEDPDAPVMDHPLLDEAERRAVLSDFNRGGSGQLPPPVLVADRIRTLARDQPDTVAIEAGDERISYSELDMAMDKVAHALVSRGMQPEDRVIVYGDRSFPSAVGLLGALRAGVAYVPVDSDLASEWMTSVIRQTRPRAILTRRHLMARAAGQDVETLALDEILAGPPVAPVEAAARPEDLAYVLYTSGSTGPPKGVMVEQRHLGWFLETSSRVQPMRPGDRVLWFHSISFDALAGNLHTPLVSGATVVMRDDAAISSITRFLEWVQKKNITHLRLPTSFFHVLAEESSDMPGSVPPSIRVTSFGGEQVRADLAARWHRHTAGQVRMFNMYGPTETTVHVTTFELTSPDGEFSEWVPIGSPLEGSTVYVLDPEGRPTPIGIPGEIHIGGHLVARGYLDAPELTAARFVADPFADHPAARMYRSGDLGRWLPDGSLEALGRIDRQLKVRGYRVEPGEIEAALRSVSYVADAAVISRPGADGNLVLHAYVTSNAGLPGSRRIHEDLAASLPAFMRPATITVVEAIPRMVSGKLDPDALPEPAAPPPAPAQPLPDEVALSVSSVWQEVLKVEAVEPASNFFELGGHSLLAIKVMSRIHDRVGVELPLTVLFEHPILEDFIAEVSARTAGAEGHASGNSSPSREGLPSQPEPMLEELLDEIERLTDEEAEALLQRLRSEASE
jgi:amino acid adenylation domain-containing protein